MWKCFAQPKKKRKKRQGLISKLLERNRSQQASRYEGYLYNDTDKIDI